MDSASNLRLSKLATSGFFATNLYKMERRLQKRKNPNKSESRFFFDFGFHFW